MSDHYSDGAALAPIWQVGDAGGPAFVGYSFGPKSIGALSAFASNILDDLGVLGGAFTGLWNLIATGCEQRLRLVA